MRTLLPLVVLVLAAGGCPRRPGSDLPDASLGPGELPPDAVPIDPDLIDELSACYARSTLFPEARIVAATEALRDHADGNTDTVLTDDACVHFLREMSGGELASAEFRAFTGEIVTAFDGEEVVFGARFVTLGRWVREADGTLSGSIDRDDDAFAPGDDFAEVRTTERTGYYRVTRFNPASRLVEWQLTQDRTVTPPLQTTEALVDGTLTVVDRTVLDPEAEMACDDAGLDCFGRRAACDAAQIANLEASLTIALARGTSCMSQLVPEATSVNDVWERLQALKNLWTRQHAWSCMPTGCSCAHWCDGCGDAGRHVIDIGYEDWTARPREMQLGTLFHEFMHGVIGGHLDVVINGTLPPGRQGTLMRRYVDRVDACEAYCFAPEPTRCACATCLDRFTCDEPCAGLASCTEWDSSAPGGTVAIMSEAVGAACVTTNAAGEEVGEWFTTMAGCRASGCASRGSCRSYSRSCEPGCE